MSTTNQATRQKNISSPLAVGTMISFQSEAERPGGPFISADMRNLRSKRNPDNQNKLSLRRRLFPRPSSVLSRPEGTIGRLARCHYGRRAVGHRVATCRVRFVAASVWPTPYNMANVGNTWRRAPQHIFLLSPPLSHTRAYAGTRGHMRG